MVRVLCRPRRVRRVPTSVLRPGLTVHGKCKSEIAKDVCRVTNKKMPESRPAFARCARAPTISAERNVRSWAGGGKKGAVCRGLERFPSDLVNGSCSGNRCRRVALTGASALALARAASSGWKVTSVCTFREFANFPLPCQSIVFDGQSTRSRLLLTSANLAASSAFCTPAATARESRQLAWPPKQQVFRTEKLCGGGGDDLCSSARSASVVVANRGPREFPKRPLDVRAIDFRPPMVSEAHVRRVLESSHLVSR